MCGWRQGWKQTKILIRNLSTTTNIQNNLIQQNDWSGNANCSTSHTWLTSQSTTGNNPAQPNWLDTLLAETDGAKKLPVARNPGICHKCREPGHFSWLCPRIDAISWPVVNNNQIYLLVFSVMHYPHHLLLIKFVLVNTLELVAIIYLMMANLVQKWPRQDQPWM